MPRPVLPTALSPSTPCPWLCPTAWPQLPGLFDVDHVAEQLLQAGILEAVYTRGANFPIRMPFQAFLDR